MPPRTSKEKPTGKKPTGGGSPEVRPRKPKCDPLKDPPLWERVAILKRELIAVRGDVIGIRKHIQSIIVEMREFMAVAQKILDAQTRQDAAISALSARIDAIPTGGMSPADEQSVADAINAASDKIDSLAPPAAPVTEPPVTPPVTPPSELFRPPVPAVTPTRSV